MVTRRSVARDGLRVERGVEARRVSRSHTATPSLWILHIVHDFPRGPIGLPPELLELVGEQAGGGVALRSQRVVQR